MLKKVTCTWAALALLAGCAAQPAAARPEAAVETAEAAVQPAQEQTTPGFANVGTIERLRRRPADRALQRAGLHP